MRIQLGSSCRPTRESGAVSLLVAILTVVLVTMLAFVTDIGMAYANKRNLQNGVDAAVLAVGNDVALSASETDDCDDLVLRANTAAHRVTADSLFRQNVPTTTAALLPGAAGLDATCEPLASDPTKEVLVIRGRTAQDSPGFFGGIIGSGDLPIGQQAKVMVGPAGTVTGLRPFALCEEVADLRHADPDAMVTIDFDNDDVGCGAASGNFGTLDLRDPPSGSPGSLPQDWTRYGYPDPISVGDPMTFQGSPGTPASNFGDDFQEILDEPIVIPVYDSLVDRGSHSDYNITGFVSVKLCGTRVGPSALYTGACFVADATTADSHARWVQVQFERFIPVGDLDLGCRLGDPCDTGLRVVKLAD